MKTDPNVRCINYVQHLGWAIVHDVIAHPFMGLTLYCKWSIRFHNYTSQKSWKKFIKVDNGLDREPEGIPDSAMLSPIFVKYTPPYIDPNGNITTDPANTIWANRLSEEGKESLRKFVGYIK